MEIVLRLKNRTFKGRERKEKGEGREEKEGEEKQSSPTSSILL